MKDLSVKGFMNILLFEIKRGGQCIADKRNGDNTVIDLDTIICYRKSLRHQLKRLIIKTLSKSKAKKALQKL